MGSVNRNDSTERGSFRRWCNDQRAHSSLGLVQSRTGKGKVKSLYFVWHKFLFAQLGVCLYKIFAIITDLLFVSGHSSRVKTNSLFRQFSTDFSLEQNAAVCYAMRDFKAGQQVSRHFLHCLAT